MSNGDPLWLATQSDFDRQAHNRKVRAERELRGVPDEGPPLFTEFEAGYKPPRERPWRTGMFRFWVTYGSLLLSVGYWIGATT